MYQSDDNVVVSYPDDIIIQINPINHVRDIKEYISKKMPFSIHWSRHDLYHRNQRLIDEQIIYASGIFHGDIIELIAIPQRTNAPPTHVI